MEKKYSILLFISCLLISCNTEKVKLMMFEIQPNNTVLQINDTVFFSNNITCLKSFENKFYVSDAVNHTVFVFDSNLQLEHTLGCKGKGPGEFNIPIDICLEDSSLYIVDGGNGRINIFERDNSSWTYAQQIPVGLNFVEENSIIIRNEHIYNTYPSRNIVHIYDMKGEKQRSFGDLVDIKQKIERNFMNIVEGSDCMILVGKSEPFFMKYNYKGELLKFKDYSDHDFFKKTMVEQKKFYEIYKTNSISNIIGDIVLAKNKLFALYFERKDKHITPKILVLSINNFELLASLNLPQGAYTKIDYSEYNECLIAYNSTLGGLQTFDLSFLK